MPSVAEQLRQAREAQQLDIYQVAEATKIRTDHLRALEEGNYDRFVAPVYIRGFARTYARLLRLDLDRFMADLDAELSRTERFAEPPSLAGPPGGPVDFVMLQLSRVNWRYVLLGGGLLAAGLAVALTLRAWQHHQRTDPLDRLGSGLYQAKDDSALDYLPASTNAVHR